MEIQPNIPDPIKRKGLKVGDKIQFMYNNEKQQDIIREIGAIDINGNKVNPNIEWRKVDLLFIITKEHYNLFYYKDPNIETKQEFNQEFDTIQKI